MNNRRHIVIVHGGRAWPRPSITRAIIREALVEGIDRVDPRAAGALRRKDVRLTITCHADLTNRILARADSALRARLVTEGGCRFLPPGAMNEALDDLVARPADRHTIGEHKALAARPDPGAARRASTSAQLRRAAPDLWSYLHDECTGVEIRTRVMLPIVRALADDGHVLVISHGTGCAVTWDALWILSRAPEFRSAHHLRVSSWITLGSPLTRRYVRQNLLDAGAPPAMRYPANVGRWLDVRAAGDRLPGRMLASGFFAPMLQRGLVESIEDANPGRPIRTYWATRRGHDPHALPGYINHPWLARRIARWMQDPQRPPEPDVVVRVNRARARGEKG